MTDNYIPPQAKPMTASKGRSIYNNLSSMRVHNELREYEHGGIQTYHEQPLPFSFAMPREQVFIQNPDHIAYSMHGMHHAAPPAHHTANAIATGMNSILRAHIGHRNRVLGTVGFNTNERVFSMRMSRLRFQRW